MHKLNKIKGSLFGLAIGDALGTTLEFERPGTFEPITDIIGGGPFNLKPGEWTDDTSMALCLAQSLIEHDWNEWDQLNKYVKWWTEGYMSSKDFELDAYDIGLIEKLTGKGFKRSDLCFDIGNTTIGALRHYATYKNPATCGRIGDFDNGNGSLMRLAPVPLFYANDIADAAIKSGESSKTTHAHNISVDCCRYYGTLIALAVNGMDKTNCLNDTFPLLKLDPKVQDVVDGSFKQKTPPEIAGTGYVVDSMEAALWAFHSTDNFRDGALKVVNLGDDADTTGAIYGMLAGAYYGFDALPKTWVNVLAKKELIADIAEKLYVNSAH